MPNTPDRDLQQDRRFVDVQAEFETAFESLIPGFLFDGHDFDSAIDHVARRFKRLIEAARGPVFDEAGYISPMETCAEAEVIRWFGYNQHRRSLLERVKNWIGLARAVNARRLLLDGSFVTRKGEPGDIDAIVLLPEDFGDRLRSGHPQAVELHKMFVTREPKELFPAEDEEDWWHWFEFFSRTREPDGRRKGLIEVTL
jgi:hypothetical protein